MRLVRQPARAAAAGALLMSLAGCMHIWCDNCRAVRPLLVDDMPPSGRNKHRAVDLLCGDCHYIVATLHESPTGNVPPAVDGAGESRGELGGDPP